ncbi:MFS transporter prlL [Colletotrichum shisoi]|uniref:MFS transporter prlL n=1 Tax=Colletotrichum shisoi TaxID=2078593 RepID=A0A5Q4BCG3_9PEZI|nr:MFS transporter prlL [Colletotrichum shisoi]
MASTLDVKGSLAPARDDVESPAVKEDLSHPSPLPTDAEEEKALLWKQDRRIIPLSASIYFLCFLDRSNIGNAKILNSSSGHDMQTETGMSNRDFTIALMIFLVAYALFEVPSNILLKKLRPSRWLAFLMFSWGAVTIGLGGANDFATVTGVRFLLGVFEAGLFPGLVYYLTFWYRHDERSVRVAMILASATLAGAFGGAIAYGIGHMNQKDLAARRLYSEGSKSSHKSMSWEEAKATLTDWRLYGHYLVYFAMSTPFSSLSLFTPSITSGPGFMDLQAQLMTVPPYAAAYVVQIIVAWSADRFNARGAHSMALALVGGIGFAVSAVLPPDAYNARYGCLIVGASGAFACIPPLLGWLTSNIFSTAATGLAIALNVSIGAGLGQIPGVWIYKAEEKARGYPTGHWANAALLFVVVVGCAGLRAYYGVKNRRILRRAQEDGTVARLYKL